MNTPQIDDIIIFLGQISVAIAAIIGVASLLYKITFSKMSKQLEKINQELHPNGGSSMRDAINRIEINQKEMTGEIKDLRKRIDDHIEWHLDNPV
jgi:hypothetical protein